jgi:Flp pilus assembly protein TadG
MGRTLRLRDLFQTSGSVAIEYGLILPVMLLFTLGIIDASRLLWTNMTLTRATEVAARCGAINVTTCPAIASIAAYAASEAQNFGISDATAANFVPNITAACGVPGQVTGVQVQGTYTFQFLVPWFPQFSASAPFGAPTMTLNATACYLKQY